VDELVQHRDLTLRPLGGALAARPEIFGGAIDADGKIIVVFDPREIGSPQQGG
jgi:chemotaxis protein histidine kinase CheA